jgi:hypothetical protein
MKNPHRILARRGLTTWGFSTQLVFCSPFGFRVLSGYVRQPTDIPVQVTISVMTLQGVLETGFSAWVHTYQTL